jgi:hypothetical protein
MKHFAPPPFIYFIVKAFDSSITGSGGVEDFQFITSQHSRHHPTDLGANSASLKLKVFSFKLYEKNY